jgi:hypothetical protein
MERAIAQIILKKEVEIWMDKLAYAITAFIVMGKYALKFWGPAVLGLVLLALIILQTARETWLE